MAANLMSLKAEVLSYFYTLVSTLYTIHYTLYSTQSSTQMYQKPVSSASKVPEQSSVSALTFKNG